MTYVFDDAGLRQSPSDSGPIAAFRWIVTPTVQTAAVAVAAAVAAKPRSPVPVLANFDDLLLLSRRQQLPSAANG
uniref:Uncharacterized protein n=1 Tax=Trichuris muris TaxID=70415 RepID=A0A5S6R217_TRIMR